MCDVTGACLFYDTYRFRYHTYGLSLVLQVVASVFSIFMTIAISKMKFPGPEEQEMTIINGKSQGTSNEVMEKVSGV